MKYYYHISYDEERDDFYAMVDMGDKTSDTLFTIENVKEVCDYIRTGKMKHIDDVEGLTKFLKEQGYLKSDDEILLDKEVLY